MSHGVIHFFPGGTKSQYEATVKTVHPADGSLPPERPDPRTLRPAGLHHHQQPPVERLDRGLRRVSSEGGRRGDDRDGGGEGNQKGTVHGRHLFMVAGRILAVLTRAKLPRRERCE